MPIGKNAIKRVTNNGYSNVKASAPDMENSVVVSDKSELVKEKLTPPTAAPIKATQPKAARKVQPKAEAQAKPKATKKASAGKSAPTPKKSMETEPELSPVKTAEKVIKKAAQAPKRQGEGYINLGGELPDYLL